MVGSFAIAFWLLCSVAVGRFAKTLGRSGAVWTLFSMICSPSLGVIIVAVLDSKAPVPNSHTRDEVMRCAEWVKYVMVRRLSLN